MRKFISLLLVASIIGLSGCSSNQNELEETANIVDGEYISSSWGNNGEIEVKVTVSEGKISNVEILSHKESKGISVDPLNIIPQQIVEYQTVGVDVLSGATMTSNGIINAVKDCLTQANASESFFSSANIPAEEVKDTECDVVVIGSGASGMASALHASQNGAKVILVEKQDILGGTSLLSNGMFGSVGTSVHKAEGKTETVEDLYNNYMKKEAATGAFAESEAAKILAENSAEQAEYLISLGVKLDHTSSAFILAPEGGSGLGSMVIPSLLEELNKNNVDVRKSTKATHILVENDAVTGVEVETDNGTYKISADAVIIATGGYAANKEMVSEYLPEWSDSIYYCSPGDTGDGLVLASEVGVDLVDMTVMKANPLVFYNRTQALTMNAAVNAGAIMVNHEGLRFANEQGSYGISPIINSQTNGEGIVLFDNTLIESNETMMSYLEQGFLTEAASLDELAEKLDIDAEALKNTVAEYQTMVKNGEDTLYNRKTLADLYSGTTFYGRIIKPSIQGTFGGIPTNTNAEVLMPDGSTFAGLYAAGECAQEGLNGLNPMTTNMVFGKIAGTNAAEYALAK